MQGIKWGIIGCGNVTEVKSGPAFNLFDDSTLIAVMRRDGEKAKDYAQRHQVPKWYDDANALINDPEINAIYIATPPGNHEVYAIAAMEAGKPVYVEKPMSVSLDSCIRMKEVSERNGVKLTVAHYRRALPMFLSIKQLLEDKKIGDIRTIRMTMLQPDQSKAIAQTEINWRVDPAIAGAGLFFDLAPHQLDLMMYYFGEPIHSTGMSANQAGLYAAEDVVTGLIRFKNDILFSGSWSFTVAEGTEEDVVEINGSKGMISFPVFGHTVTVKTKEEEHQMSFDPPKHIQQPMIEKVVRYFQGKGENPCSASDAILSMSVMEQFVYGTQK